jgi:hypothetical protein
MTKSKSPVILKRKMVVQTGTQFGITGVLDFAHCPVFEGPNRVSIFLPSPEDSNRSSFQNVVF